MEQVAGQVEKVKESVKESLLGTEIEPQLSAQTRAEFMQHAIKDEASEEYYMSEKEFVNAVAPEGEDYVRDWFQNAENKSTATNIHCSIKSSASSTPSFSRSPTAARRTVLPYKTGRSSTTC